MQSNRLQKESENIFLAKSFFVVRTNGGGALHCFVIEFL
jgi:hypothetical protein